MIIGKYTVQGQGVMLIKMGIADLQGARSRAIIKKRQILYVW